MQREALNPDPKVTGTLQGIGFGLLWCLILFGDAIARSLGG